MISSTSKLNRDVLNNILQDNCKTMLLWPLLYKNGKSTFLLQNQRFVKDIAMLYDVIRNVITSFKRARITFDKSIGKISLYTPLVVHIVRCFEILKKNIAKT